MEYIIHSLPCEHRRYGLTPRTFYAFSFTPSPPPHAPPIVILKPSLTDILVICRFDWVNLAVFDSNDVCVFGKPDPKWAKRMESHMDMNLKAYPGKLKIEDQ